MSYLFDTNILIALRDGDPATLERFESLDGLPLISIVSRVELENGVARDPIKSIERRRALIVLLDDFDILPFGREEADEYRAIVSATGFNRARVLDRMIAATARRVSAKFVTANVRDFRDIPNLQIEDWSN